MGEEKKTRECPLCLGAKVEVRLCPWCHGIEGCGACGHKRVFTRICTLCKGTGLDPEEIEI